MTVDEEYGRQAMHRILGLIGILALGVVVWIVMGFDGDEDSSLDDSDIEIEKAEVGARRVRAFVPEADLPEEEKPAALSSPKTDSPVVESEAGQDADLADRREISGRVIVIDRDGNRHENENGSITGNTWKGTRGSDFEAVVKNGRWTAMIKPARTLSFDKVILGGKPARSPKWDIEVPESGELNLEFQWVGGFKIHVVDRQTRQELSGVEIARVDHDITHHPGIISKQALTVSNGQSPVSLDAIPYARHYVVRARGYAWKGFRLTPTSPEANTVFMDREAKLVVRLLGDMLPPDARLRMSTARQSVDASSKLHGKPIEPRPYGQGVPFLDTEVGKAREFEFDGLNPGVVSVRIEVGKWYSKPVLLGGTWAVLREGETADVDVTVDAAVLDQALAPLEGYLEIDKSWPIKTTPQVTIRPLRGRIGTTQKEVRLKLKAVSGRKHVWKWEKVMLVPGRYEALIREFEKHEAFELPAEGLTDLRLRIGAQATVAVTVLTPAQASAPRSTSVYWHGAIPEGVSSYASNPAVRDEESGRHIIKCPLGKTSISASCDGFESVSTKIDVMPGKNAVTLTLKPTQGFRLRLKFKGANLPVDWNYQIDVLDQEGRDALSKGASSDGESMTKFLDPGSYTVRLGQLEGYLPIADRKVVIQAGEIVDLTVELVREQ